MKKILHISTECYPAAKAGGMGDVVGALPAYLPVHGFEASVVIPKYKNSWFSAQSFTTVQKGQFALGAETIDYKVEKLNNEVVGFPFYCIEIPGKFDRESIYLGEDGEGYSDEIQRNISFQIAVLEWLLKGKESFDGLHCHDHMTGLITFFIKYSNRYVRLAHTPTFLTIHNGQYRGGFSWRFAALFPDYGEAHNGLLDWDGEINSLATAIKCAWNVNTVSPSYMDEVIEDSDTLTPLYRAERAKCTGILNGIDYEVWDPATDQYLSHHLKGDKGWVKFKSKNKQLLLQRYQLKSRRPIISFIGRLATQKGADLLARAIEQGLDQGLKFNTIILGSGDKKIENELSNLAAKYPDDIGLTIAYDEELAHLIYAGSDYLIMPSRFEPCGLNQMYAMRYGTIPIVSAVGGLIDTVPDYTDKGNGIVITPNHAAGIKEAIHRAVTLYKTRSKMIKLRNKLVELDYSWYQSAASYAHLYHRFIK